MSLESLKNTLKTAFTPKSSRSFSPTSLLRKSSKERLAPQQSVSNSLELPQARRHSFAGTPSQPMARMSANFSSASLPEMASSSYQKLQDMKELKNLAHTLVESPSSIKYNADTNKAINLLSTELLNRCGTKEIATQAMIKLCHGQNNNFFSAHELSTPKERETFVNEQINRLYYGK